MEEPLKLLRRWADAWNNRDWDGVAETFAENGTNHSMMDVQVTGRELIRTRTRQVMESVNKIDILLLRTFVPKNGIVIAERLDKCQRLDESWGTVPVAGFYEIRNGEILAKRDYYDREQLLRAIGRN